MTVNPINIFFTPQANSGAGQGQNLSAPGQGLAFAPGLNFLNFLFENLSPEGQDGEENGNNGKSNGENLHPALFQNGSLTKKAHKGEIVITPDAETDANGNVTDEITITDNGTLALDAQSDPLSSDVTFEQSTDTAPKTAPEISEDSKKVGIGSTTQTTVGVKTETETESQLLPKGLIETTTETDIKATAKIKNFMTYLHTLLQGIPVENRPEIVKIPDGNLHKNLPDLQTPNTTEDGETSSALIASGLTPSEITEFLDNLTETLDENEVIIVGIVKFLPPDAKREAIFIPRAALLLPNAPETPPVPPATESPITPDLEISADTSTETGTETKAGNGKATLDTNQPQAPALPATANETAAQMTSLLGEEGDVPEEFKKKTGFDQVLEVLEKAREKRTSTGKETPGLDRAIERIKSQMAGMSSFKGAATPPADAMMFDSTTFDQVFPDGLDWSTAGKGQNMSFNGPALMTSLVSHAPHASHAHPAMHHVAVKISKAAAEGQNKNITLQLNPPDLGRVEIRMEFTKEKTAKVHLLSEKPETHMMLQRDAMLLERALQDAGLDADGSSLSFELAQDGNLFDHGGQQNRGGNDSGGSTGSSDETDEMEIIEASVDWYIDPETGMTRYDILA